ncbi:MAG: conserved exported protein of unknown function [Nitrospira sp.]|nr:MAG: conserved exported protein of unknown function [Nitrospira sp.]
MKAILLIISIVALAGCTTSPMLAGENGYPGICKEFMAEAVDELDDSYLANRDLWETFNKRYEKDSGRRLVVFMDGTGNDKSNHTNVRKLYRLAVQQACSGQPVIPYYDKGVGAKWFDRVRGGLGGRGTSLNIRQAYRFLVESYKPDDEIYLIGFSRGAFTARSLNGFIELAGLIDKKTITPRWYDGGHVPGVSSLHLTVKAIYDVYQTKYDGIPDFEKRLKAKLEDEEYDLGVKSYKVKVSAIGVFDTVPALGILQDDEPDSHRLDLYATQGFHALSLDEQRDAFRLLRFDPLRLDGDQQLSEVWFAGVHSDVGGSYSMSYDCVAADGFAGLATTPLNWMIRKLDGFRIFPEEKQYVECVKGRMHDEYFDGVHFIYENMGAFQRKPRPGDSVHSSVVKRMSEEPLCRPHEKREPGGHYYFMSRPNPKDIADYFRQNSLNIVD